MNRETGKSYTGEELTKAIKRKEKLLDISLEVHNRIVEYRKEKAEALRKKRQERNLQNQQFGGWKR